MEYTVEIYQDNADFNAATIYRGEVKKTEKTLQYFTIERETREEAILYARELADYYRASTFQYSI